MRKFKAYQTVLAVLALMLQCSSFAGAGKKKNAAPADDSWKSDPQFDLAVDKIVARETLFLKNLGEYSPMVETYIQNMRPDKELGSVPAGDEYFLGRIKLQARVEDVNFLPAQQIPGTSSAHKIFGGMLKLGKSKPNSAKQTGGYMSEGFAQMVVIDQHTFDRQHYDFHFVRREFLGEVRTLVIDVKPKAPQTGVMFIGRIWAEDQQYNVVRFNGTYTPRSKTGAYVHFDSWRENMVRDRWLPAYIYSEETDLVEGKQHWNFRGRTLLWGYDVLRSNHNSEFTDIAVESPDKVRDQSNAKGDLTTVGAERAWQRQAEDNVLDRMQRAGFLAPEGEVDKVLDTVVGNIEATNNLEVEPEIRCRILLTQPLESFTVGHTIVVSRGLLDALPDEASLAAILAHEMGHIVASHQLNEKYAFSDEMIFPDSQIISSIAVTRTSGEEKEADAKAVELLGNSPYKDKLASAGLFLAATQADAPQLPNLLKGQFGNPLDTSANGVRMPSLVSAAPALQKRDVKQVAALPLGGRIRLDAWSDQLALQNGRPVHLLSASEKMPFQVTPMFPYLTRQEQGSAAGQPAASLAASPVVSTTTR
jgi:hypothetical protein